MPPNVLNEEGSPPPQLQTHQNGKMNLFRQMKGGKGTFGTFETAFVTKF